MDGERQRGDYAESDVVDGTAVPDSRQVVNYLVRPEAHSYIAIMDVLEKSVTDLTPAEITAALVAAGQPADRLNVEARLDQLRAWGAVSARTDATRILRYADLVARNWRWTATPVGRQAQRFYRTVLAGTPVLREIPLTGLNRIVTSAETLARTVPLSADAVAGEAEVDLIGTLFTAHDDLDGALVGAEDALAALADRFDLDDDATGELKGLVVDYATRVAAELDTGSARAARALATLAPYYAALADATVAGSQARTLIEAGALTASRGGRTSDWEGLRAWFDPDTGRAARFSLRLVRALPGMHANLRRLHSSVGRASSRTRALLLARASADPELGTQVWQAAVGDHAWRKLTGEAEDPPTGRLPSWRGGPQVGVPDMIRAIGRSGARGKGAPSRDDAAARAEVAAARARRAAEHAAALIEVLRATPGAALSGAAAHAALAALMVAARAQPDGVRRSGARDGLACTLVHTGAGTGVLRGPTWQVLLPGRLPLFHEPGRRPAAAALEALRGSGVDPDNDATVEVHVRDLRDEGAA